MDAVIDSLVAQFERGTLSRRQLIATLGGMAAMAAGARVSAQGGAPTFKATGLNHIALRVPDVQRSRDFYVKHLGVTPVSESPSNVFMTFGDNFLALFKGDTPGMDHFCFSVKDYDVTSAVKTLDAAGLNPDNPSGTERVYFKDPDGLTVQLASDTHTP